jgi:hypothetical protein
LENPSSTSVLADLDLFQTYLRTTSDLAEALRKISKWRNLPNGGREFQEHYLDKMARAVYPWSGVRYALRLVIQSLGFGPVLILSVKLRVLPSPCGLSGSDVFVALVIYYFVAQFIAWLPVLRLRVQSCTTLKLLKERYPQE